MVACESATVAGTKKLLMISFVLLVLNSAVVDVLIAVIVVAIVNAGFAVSEVTCI